MLSETCRHKKRYKTGPEARRALERIRRAGPRDQRGKPARAYACHECGGWHLTSWLDP